MEKRENDDDFKEKQPFSARLKSYFKNLIKFSQYDTKTIIYITIFIFLFAISLFLLYYIFFIDETILYKFVVNYFVNPIYKLQVIGIFLFIAIMAFQGLIVPIPSEVVLLATGMIWDVFLGGIMGIIGSMAAGLLCFYISKKGGRPLAEKFVGEKAINIADEFIKKHGIKAIIITRFIPFIPFDVISYTSGLVDIDIKKYSIGTLIGSIFRAFFYALLGSLFFSKYNLSLPIDFDTLPLGVIQEQSIYFNTILLIILGVLVLMFILYYVLIKYLEKKG
ncbi:MAG: VTT domain-containing protein [Candidatus Lokiarchaeota archaeon]|nr:VTT domain-containing protein [Candidatus Lokiarchaeota archaeon]